MEKMYGFLAVIERADGNYSAYSPDLPGGVAIAESQDRARNIYEAIEMQIRGLLEDKFPVPESHSFAEYVAVPSEAPWRQKPWGTEPVSNRVKPVFFARRAEDILSRVLRDALPYGLHPA